MSTYIYGKLTKTKFYTPHRTYTHKTSFPPKMFVNNFFPCKLDDSNNLQIFYNSPVFNSFLTVEEEEVYKIFSIDNKTTIIKSKIEPNVLYTFCVIEETNSLRICEIYKDNLFWVGKKTTGKLQLNKKKCEVETPIGKGECKLQNNHHIKNLSVLLWKICDDKLYFVEVNNPVREIIEVVVDEVRDSFILVSNGNIKGMVFINNYKQSKTPIKVYVKEELLGFYIFEISSDILIGSYIDSKIVKKTDTRIFLKYQSYDGFIDCKNIDLLQFKSNNKTLKGKVINFKDNNFELSQIQGISVPFDVVVSESEENEEVIEFSSTLSDLLNLIKQLTENKRYKNVTELYYKYINTLNIIDKDNLSLVYCNFLQFTVDDKINLIKEIKKVSSFCSEKFIEKVGSVSDIFEVIEFCYKKSNSKDLYIKYIDMCYKLDKNITDFQYLDILIDFYYKYEEMPRIKTEKIVGNNRLGWIAYIKNEKDDYKRVLYRRVVNLSWKVSEMKEWYRMWMEYEKEHDGNLDEVRSRAKEFVESVKIKN